MGEGRERGSTSEFAPRRRKRRERRSAVEVRCMVFFGGDWGCFGGDVELDGCFERRITWTWKEMSGRGVYMNGETKMRKSKRG